MQLNTQQRRSLGQHCSAPSGIKGPGAQGPSAQVQTQVGCPYVRYRPSGCPCVRYRPSGCREIYPVRMSIILYSAVQCSVVLCDVA